jgi:hypothetical protein
VKKGGTLLEWRKKDNRARAQKEDKMSLFDQISNAKTSNRGAKIQEPRELGTTAEFIVKLDDVKLQQSNRGMKTVFVAEFTILEGTERTPAGCQRSWVQFPEHREQTDPGNIRAFVQALLGKEDVSGADIQSVVEGKANGAVLKLSVEKIETQSGRDFWVHTWRPSDGAAALPEIPSLTKEAWLKGEGPGKVHPKNPAYEYSPDHPEWGVRPV